MIDYLKNSLKKALADIEFSYKQNELWQTTENILDECKAGEYYDSELAISVFTEFFSSLSPDKQEENIYWYKAIITYLDPVFAFSNFLAECSHNAEIDDIELEMADDCRHVTLIASSSQNINNLKNTMASKLPEIKPEELN